MRLPRGPLFAAGAAFSFGLLAPATKAFLEDLHPLLLTAGAYGAAGAILALARAPAVLRGGRGSPGLPRGRRELLAIAVGIAMGGFLGPVALFAGMRLLPAYESSLLLNAETVFTIAIAVSVFRERLSGTAWTGAALLCLGAAVLSAGGGDGGGAAGGDGTAGSLRGVVLVLAACLAWAIDTNAGKIVAHRDPAVVSTAKCAGGALLGLSAWALAAAPGPLPTGAQWAALTGVGAVCFGLSLVLFFLSLRVQGTARTSALFTLAPLFGAAVSFLALGERPGWGGAAALLLMPLGALLLAREAPVPAARSAPPDALIE